MSELVYSGLKILLKDFMLKAALPAIDECFETSNVQLAVLRFMRFLKKMTLLMLLSKINMFISIWLYPKMSPTLFARKFAI